MENSKVKSVILDFDGVIVDTLDHCIQEIRQIVGSYGCTMPSRQELLGIWGMIFEDYLAEFFPGISLEMYLRRRMELGLDKHIPPLVEGSKDAIKELSAGFELAIISNREKQTLHEIIGHHELEDIYFSYIQSCTDSEYHKPDPRVFDGYFNNGHGEAGKDGAVYVGDLISDYRAAKNAGLQFVGVLSGGITKEADFLQAGLKPGNIIESVTHLPQLLARRKL